MVSNAKQNSKNHELFYNELKTLDPEEVPTRIILLTVTAERVAL